MSEPFDNVELTFVRGDDWKKTFLIKTNGTAIDPSGWHLWFTLKENEDDIDDDAIVGPFDYTIPTVNADKTFLWLCPNTETSVTPGIYYFDFQLVDGSGYVTTLMLGRATVKKDITRKIA